MDGKEGMAFSDSYYIHRGDIGEGFQAPPGFSPNAVVSTHRQHVRDSSASVATTHSVDYTHNHHGSSPGTLSEPVKKKRGRPRKYAPDGPVSLRLSPMSNSTPTPSSTSPSHKRNRGRPPGTGRKQQLATLGEWMNSSAGTAFAPYVVIIGAGEDIVAKLLSISQQRPRALCILSGTGTVSSVTLRQPASTVVSVSLEGRFQILCLSGSYLVAEEGGLQDRTGGVSVSLASPEGHVIGGGAAMLIASSPVQVVVCSFVHGESKTNKTRQVSASKDENCEDEHDDKLATSASAPPVQNYSQSFRGMWPSGLRNGHTGIDLTRG